MLSKRLNIKNKALMRFLGLSGPASGSQTVCFSAGVMISASHCVKPKLKMNPKKQKKLKKHWWCVDEVDPFRLWLIELMAVIVLLAMRKVEVQPRFSFCMACLITTAGSSRQREPSLLKWCPLLVTNQTHKEARRNNTACNSTLGPSALSCDPVQLLSAPTGNPFHTLGSFTLWMLENQPFEQ